MLIGMNKALAKKLQILVVVENLAPNDQCTQMRCMKVQTH
jgi:hypothetical protein